ncbi:hypothetical protein [Salinimicrobium soli]|uniref:hypothetical protein n=1 Tax=Salinimicrobium soli TaxID=1254399 RepID=UPI003AAD2341
MTQENYSMYARKELLSSFPYFSDYERFENDVYIVEFPSPHQTVLLWVSTQDKEITIGFDQNKDCVWHMHMSQLGANEIQDELKEVIHLIKRIINGSELIAIDSEKEIYLTSDTFENEKIKKWNEL